MASLRQTPTVYDMEKRVAHKEAVAHKEGPKKSNEAQSKKRRASTVVTSGKKIIPIHTGRKRRRGKKHGKQEIGGIPNLMDETICHAGFECHLGDIDVVVEGNGSNGSLCCKCQQTFHFACLH